MDELGIGGELKQLDRLRQQEHRRRRGYDGARHRDDGADRAIVLARSEDRARGVAWANQWLWPNVNANCTSIANNASRAPCLIFDRNHFIWKSHPTSRGADPLGFLRCYNVTSQHRSADVNGA
jgi:hypothetical protein